MQHGNTENKQYGKNEVFAFEKRREAASARFGTSQTEFGVYRCATNKERARASGGGGGLPGIR